MQKEFSLNRNESEQRVNSPKPRRSKRASFDYLTQQAVEETNLIACLYLFRIPAIHRQIELPAVVKVFCISKEEPW